MRAWIYENGKTGQIGELLPLLMEKGQKRKPLVIAAAGAGGKTSLLWQLAGEARRMGLRTVLGTTTHMLLYRDTAVLDGDERRAAALLEERGFVCIGTPCAGAAAGNEVKCQRAPARLRQLLKERAELILEEADGSRRLPAKFPRADEPVLYGDTGLLLAVMGLSALERRAGEAFHRRELYPGGLSPETSLAEEHLACALSEGYLRRVPMLPASECLGEAHPCRGVRVIPVLNQADTPERLASAQRILETVLTDGEAGLITCFRDGAMNG